MAKFKGRSVTLNKPFRSPTGTKKFAVYVRNRRTNRVQIVRFGFRGMSIKKNIPSRQRSFLARMGGVLKRVKGQKSLSPAFWSMRSWRKGFKI
tara:strand:- start:1322 stop:1600 length:279 start_codon:yes stop_codon:yes gene_type:complete